MHAKLPAIATIAFIIPLITSADGMGVAIIQNRCQFPIYLWPTDSERNPLYGIAVAAGSQYSEQYRIPSSGGVSIKISTRNDKQSPITQFEYTVKAYAGNQLLWYDGSNINCSGAECPFWSYGITLKATDLSCPTRECAMAQVCDGFYNVWNDDTNTLSCSQEASTFFTVCSSDSGSDVLSKQASAVEPASSSVTSARKALTTTIVSQYSNPSQRAKKYNRYQM